MNNLITPIQNIGEENWITKLTDFLEEYDVETEGLESIETAFKIPQIMQDYYLNFGGIDSSDFMYNLI